MVFHSMVRVSFFRGEVQQRITGIGSRRRSVALQRREHFTSLLVALVPALVQTASYLMNGLIFIYFFPLISIYNPIESFQTDSIHFPQSDFHTTLMSCVKLRSCYDRVMLEAFNRVFLFYLKQIMKPGRLRIIVFDYEKHGTSSNARHIIFKSFRVVLPSINDW